MSHPRLTEFKHLVFESAILRSILGDSGTSVLLGPTDAIDQRGVGGHLPLVMTLHCVREVNMNTLLQQLEHKMRQMLRDMRI